MKTTKAESEGFINITKHTKSEILTDEEKQEIIKQLQEKTGEQWKHYILTYFVSDQGKAYSAIKNDLIKLSCDKDKGYYYFCISYKGKTSKPIAIHSIVNSLFNHDTVFDPVGVLCGAYGAFDTHHINFDKLNNTPDNLVWMDHRLHAQMHRELQLNKLDKSEIDTPEKIKAYEERKSRERQRMIDIQSMLL